MKIKELLAPIVSIVIIGSVLFGIIYFLIGWEWLKGYLEIVFTLASRWWGNLTLAMLGWGFILVCLSRERLGALMLAFPVRFFTAVSVIYIIWGREGIDALHSLGERIPMAIIMIGLVVVLNVVGGVVSRGIIWLISGVVIVGLAIAGRFVVFFQALLNVFNRRSGK